jgi:nitrate reductase molybdenum cofactor assembly chaperone NarJ/NarW
VSTRSDRRRTRPGQLTDDQRRIGLQAGGLLLGYPDDRLHAALPLLREVAGRLPVAAAVPLLRITDHLAVTDRLSAQVAYVEQFDLRRRSCLYLTYYAYGDTRKRGMALLRFTHAYRAAGFSLAGDELPDHLAVVCEFAAAGDLGVALRLLTEQRAGLELIRTALAEAGSLYVDAVDVIRAVLPEPAPGDLRRALELARSGPPAEEVGLEPFAPPEYMGAPGSGAR